MTVAVERVFDAAIAKSRRESLIYWATNEFDELPGRVILKTAN